MCWAWTHDPRDPVEWSRGSLADCAILLLLTRRTPLERGPLFSEHLGRNAFYQLQDGQQQKEGHLGPVLPAASPRSRFCQEHLETGTARQAGREIPPKCKCRGREAGRRGAIPRRCPLCKHSPGRRQGRLLSLSACVKVGW